MDGNRPFVHLHVHTHYSLLDGATRIDALVDAAGRMGQPAVAISDHGNMFGVVELYERCRKAGVKPIIGCEVYLATGDRRVHDSGGQKESYHLLLLAQDLTGYRNLMQLSSLAFTEGFYRKPRIDKELLRRYSEGLICTSTCLGGEIPQMLLRTDHRAAEELVRTYLEIFGQERFFIELQDHGLDEQKLINPELVDIARRCGIGLVATNDVHYLEHEDAAAHDVLLCINTAAKLSDEDRFRFQTDQFYLKSGDEMAALFPDLPEAIDNTLLVAGMCNVELDFSRRYAPVFQVPAEFWGGTGGADVLCAPDSGVETPGSEGQSHTLLGWAGVETPGSESAGVETPGSEGQSHTLLGSVGVETPGSEPDAVYLRHLVYEGAKQRYGQITDELRERIDYELSVITGRGFASYFLIVHDFVNFARSKGIPCGARGSGCSSVVAYCLRISAPDPIRYGLYFERFMDPDRDEMPDIDIDICQNGRADVIDYVRGRYGHVAQIITFNTLKARAAVKDVARVMGMSFERANELTKLIPFELNMTIDRAIAAEPELSRLYHGDAEVKKIIDVARKIEGLARNSGVHAAGVVVADQPMVNFLPLCRTTGSDVITTQYDGPTVEKVGLLKMDFLGLRTLTVLERARQLAEQGSGQKIDLESLDLTDQRAYELFHRGDTKGVFQFESGGMRDVLMRMRPNRIEDLIATNALYRPGPMQYIDAYIARKHGERWTTPHPIMSEVLQETFGIMVYQEQVSRLVNRLGGIELKAAFRLAKAISKKKTEMIERMREPFLAGCAANGVARATAEQIFDDILRFGGYAFNKAHSTGYAIVAFQTAWMKTYFPVEFMAAAMTFEMHDIEKIAEYREDCRRMGVGVDPPDVNRSEAEFTVIQATAGQAGRPAEKARIVFGLGAIKGLGEKPIEAITSARRQGGDFKDLYDFCERVDLSTLTRATLEALISAGAFDRTGAMRKAMCLAVEDAIAAGQQYQQDRKSGQGSLFGDALSGGGGGTQKLTSAEWTEAEMLAREKAVLGFYVTRHPLVSHEAVLEACSTASIADVSRLPENQKVVLGGLVTNVRTVIAKGGRKPGSKMGVVTLEDLTGQIEVVLFSEELERFRGLLNADAVIFVEGEVDRRREQPCIRTRRIIPVGDALAAFGDAVLLRLPGSADAGVGGVPGAPTQGGASAPAGDGAEGRIRESSDAVLTPLIALLRRHRGGCSTYLEIPTAEGYLAMVECGRDHRVACGPAFLHEAANLLGLEAVRVVGPSRKPIPWRGTNGNGD